MAEVNNNNECLFAAAPYEVYVNADATGYFVLNADTGVTEVEDTVLCKCITFADHSASFLASVAAEESADSGISIYPEAAMPSGKLN